MERRLRSPHPLGAALPAVYGEDDYVQRMTAGLDEVLAPAIVALDCFDSYLDPWLAPRDFLAWLGRWVATDSNGALPRDEPVDEVSAPPRRDTVAGAMELARWRGTAAGVARRLSMLARADVTVHDTGGCTYSETPGSDFPGSGDNEVLVTVSEQSGVDPGWLAAAATREVPAHCRVVVRVR